MNRVDIMILELYEEYSETLVQFRESCDHIMQTITYIDEMGENASELITPVIAEAEKIIKDCNKIKYFEEMSKQMAKDESVPH